MARLSHKRVMEIKLTVARSALRQMRDMAERDIRYMEASKDDYDGGYISNDAAINMFRQFSNIAYFTLTDLEASDEQITGLSHG